MPDIVKELRAKYSRVAIDPDRLFLLRAADAIQLINEAARNGLQLAGVEGFRVSPEGGVQPVQEFSNDIADGVLPLEQFVEHTIQLVEQGREQEIAFEVVFEGLGNLANGRFR